MINNDLCILGSTGSIGSQTLEVAEHLGLRAIFLAGGRNVPLMETQARRFLPRAVAMGDSGAARDLKVRLADTPIQVLSGGEGVCALAADRSAGTVVTAITGLDGLAPTLAALEGGRRVALAGKESLVCAGSLVMKRAKEQNSVILPVDSEHSAIFQCLQTERGGVADADAQRTDAQRSDAPWTAALRTDAPWTDALRAGDVEKLILTASGGPFFGFSRAQLRTVTPADALNHPTWRMGGKITLDSATLVNKGLECIEATHLFGLPIDRIHVVVHRQSIIHSMVVFRDGATLAQLGAPDMRLPIQYALTYPRRLPSLAPSPDWAQMGSLSFAPPDEEAFPAIRLAREAAARRGTAPAVYNAAADVASKMFLAGEIGFLDISARIAHALDAVPAFPLRTLEDVYEADAQARRAAGLRTAK